MRIPCKGVGQRATHHVAAVGCRVLRHPSYFGWFWWAVGTQVLLSNPVCAVAYGIISWKFFHERIRYEEHKLHQFFPEYRAYVQRSYIGIPGIPNRVP